MVESQPVTFEISLRTMMRIVLVILGLFFLFIIRDIIVLLLLGIILASGIDPIATKLERKGLPRIIGVLLVYAIAAALLAGLAILIVPQLTRDLRDFAVRSPAYFGDVARELERLGFLRREFLFENFGQVLKAGKFPQIIFGIFGGVISALSVFLISVYLALQKDGVERFLRLLAPSDAEPYIVDLWHRAERKIGHWLRGQVMLSVLIGVIAWLGLSLLGVNYALLLAVIAAILEVVPIVGPVTAGLLAVSIAFLQTPILALITGAFYVAVQQIEGNILVPLVFRRVLGLHPVVVILALLVGARLGGVVGIILAVPLTAVLIEFLSDWARGKVKL